jgi:hypothetical protein
VKIKKRTNADRSRAAEYVDSLAEWCGEFERTLASLSNAADATEQASRYMSHFQDMLLKELETGVSITDAEKKVLRAVLSADGIPRSAANRHHRASTSHWRFYSDGPDRSAGYSSVRTHHEDERQSTPQAEVGKLIDLLLREFRIPAFSQSLQDSKYLEDLKYLLTTDYREVVRRFLNRDVLRELSKVSEDVIRPASKFLRARLRDGGIRSENARLLDPLNAIFRPDDLEIRAEPYRTGAGLSLRGFYCRANISDKSRIVIFLNTAHCPGAVATTFAHELGHHVYERLYRGSPVAAWEGAFHSHLEEPDEVFADTLVSLSMYSSRLIRKIRLSQRPPVDRIDFVRQVKFAYGLMPFPYRVDLLDTKLNKVQRLYYLAELVHFLRLRAAVHSCLQI